MGRHPLSYSPIERFLKGLFAALFFTVVYLWVSADAWEESLVAEQTAQQQRVPLRDLTIVAIDEDDQQWAETHEPQVQPDPMFNRVTRSVKKNTVKAKRKIKRALKRNN